MLSRWLNGLLAQLHSSNPRAEVVGGVCLLADRLAASDARLAGVRGALKGAARRLAANGGLMTGIVPGLKPWHRMDLAYDPLSGDGGVDPTRGGIRPIIGIDRFGEALFTTLDKRKDQSLPLRASAT